MAEEKKIILTNDGLKKLEEEYIETDGYKYIDLTELS